MSHIPKSIGNEYQPAPERMHVWASPNTHAWAQVYADFYQWNCRYW